MLQITIFLLLTRIGIRKIFWICNLEYPNSKTYWWILMTISEHVRNGPNYQVTNLLCLSGSLSRKYCGLLIRNVQTKKYHWWMLVKFQYFYQKWAKLQIKRFFSLGIRITRISIKKIFWISNAECPNPKNYW